jgi:hypothetical protein
MLFAAATIIFTLATKTNEAAVRASFIVSQITAKKSKQFAGCDYVKECIMNYRSSVACACGWSVE